MLSSFGSPIWLSSYFFLRCVEFWVSSFTCRVLGIEIIAPRGGVSVVKSLREEEECRYYYSTQRNVGLITPRGGGPHPTCKSCTPRPPSQNFGRGERDREQGGPSCEGVPGAELQEAGADSLLLLEHRQGRSLVCLKVSIDNFLLFVNVCLNIKTDDKAELKEGKVKKIERG